MRIEYIMERSDHKIVESNFNQIVGPADVLELAGNILENYYNGLIMIKRSSGKKKKHRKHKTRYWSGSNTVEFYSSERVTTL